MELCQLDKLYVHSLVQYNRVLLQRNRLLKELAFKPEYETTLDIWDEQLVKYGVEVITSRRLFIEQLGGIISGIHARLSGERKKYRFSMIRISGRRILKPHWKRTVLRISVRRPRLQVPTGMILILL